MDVLAATSVIVAGVAAASTGINAFYSTRRTAKTAREGRAEQRAADGYLKVLSLAEQEARWLDATVFAALSVRGCMALVARIVDLVGRRSQFISATHSPILLAVPGATILQIDDEGHLERVAFDNAEPVALTRRFLGAPDRFLRYLLDADE